jgi:uncharacterized protein
MKKRLRKKKRIGEFIEWGRRLVVTRNSKDGFDEFFDAFIEEAIETNGCFCGGGGKEDNLDIIVELGQRSTDPEPKFERIAAWLSNRFDVQCWQASGEFDLWHGDCPAVKATPEPHAARLKETADTIGPASAKNKT